jgi:hypothetical protein
MVKRKRTNNDLQNTTQKTKMQATENNLSLCRQIQYNVTSYRQKQ